ncbi:PREDICTED: phospholipid scramblase 2-like isoform X2 [Amphimedon queenslandica]|uniref:Phospholipid scramblase n=1 Tax=Amphimedon queenslandica TaxID=400682 RepID=A0A1X7VVQ2_AMPQE|nr:PREDICTED: phospholipid scramblase 2-like isoform X2 [Amphimedon queenslandica]|eukprot:XP_019864431.1 PREDICTED: phospholipid scramblase 2-like isoform X2 [Amphimedon queenslandica]
MAAAPPQVQWMPPPQQGLPGCPPGLEYLTQVDQLLVNQQIELLEIMTGFETQNKYKVRNSLGQQVYFAAEDSNCCLRQYCGPSRPFGMQILDNNQREVIHLERPLRCSSWCCFCCLQTMEVQSPPGTVIGFVEQDCSLVYPWFSLKNADGETVLKIKGPLCPCKCCYDVEFQVLSADGTQEVGKISKKWSGLAKEYFTDADNFGVTFPMDLDVKMKAVMLAATFLIDFMFFEDNQNNRNN